MNIDIHFLEGAAEEALLHLEDDSIDSIVTDPPYGIGFMGKGWDKSVPTGRVWEECYRVLKPGGHLLAFAGTRTQHRMATAIEDVGFEIRDMIAWTYGTGFPKGQCVGRAIDKKLGAERDLVRQNPLRNITYATSVWKQRYNQPERNKYGGPVTPEAKQWEGWGTTIRPALEPITAAQKPISEKSVAENVMKWGTGALNIDASRIGNSGGYLNNSPAEGLGRYPTNLIHDGSDEVLSLFHDAGFAQRFYYVPKPSKAERGDYNRHPTVKPIDLMRYLVTMVTPPGGWVLDPFAGSGSTGLAAYQAGMRFVGIDSDPESVEVSRRRLEDLMGDARCRARSSRW